MGAFDPWDWLVVIVVALIIFGPKRIPEIARALGKGIREFKNTFKEATQEDLTKPTAPPPEPPKSQPPINHPQ